MVGGGGGGRDMVVTGGVTDVVGMGTVVFVGEGGGWGRNIDDKTYA